MNAQLTFDDLTESAKSRALDHANPEWVRAAKWAIVNVSKLLGEFTTDDVWESLEKSGHTTHEPRALGALMTKAAKAGFIEKIEGKWIKSRRKEAHSRPLQAWKSI